MIRLFLMIYILIARVDSALAEFYHWGNEARQVHLGNKLDSKKHAQKAGDFEHVAYRKSASDSDSRRVIMYATSWCGYCRKARNYFKANNIVFTEYDIEKDKRAKKQYDAMGGRGVPVILVGKQRMNGFSVSGFKRMYESVTH